ncbi:MFS transporter [Candidatus Pacearchaeota archaeon]|nr:MFS transporter [Candidatus Pacearchaeota archaeon]
MALSDKRRRLFERNITLQYVIGSLMWGRFFIPVLALFYIASQVSLEQFAIIMAVFALSTLVLEIPTGVLADLLGRKKTLLISRFMYIIEIVILAFFNGFWPFLIAKIISGIGVSMSSGTGSALLYDTLKRLRRTDEHKKIAGTALFISSISMAFVFIVGAYLFSLNPKLPAYASLPLIIIGFLLTFFLKEPYEPHVSLSMRSSLHHLKKSIQYFMQKPYLRYLAFFTLAVGATTSMLLSLSSAYFTAVAIPFGALGIVSFIFTMASAYSAKWAHVFEERFGEMRSLVFTQILLIISVALLALMLPYWGALFFLGVSLVQGFFGIVTGDYVNRHITTSHRATMISINNMFDNIGIAVLFPLLGYAIKVYSTGTALALYTGFLIVYCICLAFYRRTFTYRQRPLITCE